jgi:hypothetical protein
MSTIHTFNRIELALKQCLVKCHNYDSQPRPQASISMITTMIMVMSPAIQMKTIMRTIKLSKKTPNMTKNQTVKTITIPTIIQLNLGILTTRKITTMITIGYFPMKVTKKQKTNIVKLLSLWCYIETGRRMLCTHSTEPLQYF